ncbi:family 1 glycosylhydrolase [uncultured Sphingomonas sp.]|uniref:family 1 glycosylhydrolase n=1 Tax=uncultured Sphingomonas sp. TaxID=158754 RepID=UPI0035CA5231
MKRTIEADGLPELEMWGGAECTVARVGDRWGDQTRLSGHHERDGDLAAFADLGFRALRYPVLWERVAPDRPEDCDWSWTDRRLGRLRDLGVRPIAGLVHHGSGPHHTNLLDPEFPAKLGEYAGRVARRYPWVTDYTPVNEPLTTARFSALYGYWHPHHRDEGSFWTALVNQVDGVGHAMRAIREVAPDARLIQTDDLGRTYATAPMFGQAAFDNLRRWAGWDLLFGRVTPGHPLWDRLAYFGLGRRLEALAAAPCPPDIVGVNHYLTSDRFLDHRIQRYPARTHGANYDGRYADVEAVRVLEPAPGGLAGALREAWERYRVPLAITEVHLGCTREEQLRWVGEAWDTARALRAAGVDLRAVTAWAMLGSHGWNTLLTADGVYEPGLFDVGGVGGGVGSGVGGGSEPRPTALAHAWRGLPGNAERHPVARTPGWWRRPSRLIHPPVRRPARFECAASALPATAPAPAPPLLIYGAAGALGRAIARQCDGRGIRYLLAEHPRPGRETAIAAMLDRHRPWAVIEADGRAGVIPRARLALARAAGERGIRLLGFMEDLDAGADAAADGRLLIRTGAVFGPEDEDGPAVDAARALGEGRRFAAADDRPFSPAFRPRLADAALDLLIDGASGDWRLAHGPPMTPAAFARRVARACGLDPSLVDGAPSPAPPAPLPCVGEAALGDLDEALGHFARGWTQNMARRAEAGETRAA